LAKSIPVAGKIAMVAALAGMLFGSGAYLFFAPGSEGYELLIAMFKIMWAVFFILYIFNVAYVADRSKNSAESDK
jgi:uncharacterized membrane protein